METPTCLTPKATRSTVRSSQQWDDVGEVCVTVDPDEVPSISFSAMQNPKPADIIGMFSSFLSIIAQIFVCVVTRSTTAEVQHNDMMMWTNVQSDLRHEMALEMWIVSVHEKSEQL